MPDNNNNAAPFTITRHIYDALVKAGYDIKYYDWCHEGPLAPVGKNDIVLGHPNYSPNTATRRLFEQKCKAKILIFPFHHRMEFVNWPFDDLVRKCDSFLAITGQYWYDTIGSTRFAHWRNKMIHLDMAVNGSSFPKVKTGFSPRGARTFVYLGSDIPEKNLGMLHAMFINQPFHLHIYGMVNSEIPLCRLPNISLYGWTSTTPEWASDLAQKADCFLSTSVSDANPTTLLEAGCWGFQVACTPQSGYWPDHRSNNLFHGLNPNDIEGCVNFLHWLSNEPEQNLLARSEATRQTILEKYNWNVFTSKVLQTIEKFL